MVNRIILKFHLKDSFLYCLCTEIPFFKLVPAGLAFLVFLLDTLEIYLNRTSLNLITTRDGGIHTIFFFTFVLNYKEISRKCTGSKDLGTQLRSCFSSGPAPLRLQPLASYLQEGGIQKTLIFKPICIFENSKRTIRLKNIEENFFFSVRDVLLVLQV